MTNSAAASVHPLFCEISNKIIKLETVTIKCKYIYDISDVRFIRMVEM